MTRTAAGLLALCLVAGTGVALSAGPAQAAPASNWAVAYDDAVPTAARPAVQRAVDAWAQVFGSDQAVRLAVSWGPLPGPTSQLAVGTAGDLVVHSPDTGVLYPVALEEAVEHTDLNAGGPDVRLALDASAPWGFDASAPSSSTYDLSSYAMRALGAGLGLSSGLAVTTSPPATAPVGSFGSDDDGDGTGDGSYWPVYDSFVSATVPYRAAVTDYVDKSAALATALTSGRLTWSGPLATAAAGGAPVLSSPSTWSAGSSASLLDEAAYPPGSVDALMTPVLAKGEVVAGPGRIAPAMLRDLMSSPLAAGAPVAHYVNALYHSFLFRDADATGLPYWSGRLVTGDLSRLDLASSLSTSQEYLQVQVGKLYNDVLGRSPDQAGLQSWVQQIRAGLPLATVGASFYASDENFALAGGTAGNPGPWVESLYRALLGRASDPNGKASWVVASRQKGRLYVTTAFYGSTETLARRVNNLYLSLLDRDADPTGLAFWPAVVRDRGDLALAATLATSDEYVQRADDLPLPGR